MWFIMFLWLHYEYNKHYYLNPLCLDHHDLLLHISEGSKHNNTPINLMPAYHRYRLRVGLVEELITKFAQGGGDL